MEKSGNGPGKPISSKSKLVDTWLFQLVQSLKSENDDVLTFNLLQKNNPRSFMLIAVELF